MEIMNISKDKLPEAMDLVWKVFLEFEAPDYSQEGINTFREFLDEQLTTLTIELYGAYDNSRLLGVIATRNEGSHIALFFVEKKHQGRGIGKKLFQRIVLLCENAAITVNSSPYAVKIYRKLGFQDTETEQLSGGIRYVPMKYQCVL